METETYFPALAGAEFMVLTTHRRTGEPVPTTVWFAQVGDRLYVTTMGIAGKANRLVNNDQVLVAPSDARGTVLGPGEPAQARLLDPAEYAVALDALRTKYNPQFDEIVSRDAERAPAMGGRIYLEVRPAERAIA
jgi:PPOX class probable F420-dependent enzyme